ncbi:2Fe-2S ferredoxin [Paenibacillus sp. MY03]|jgi:nitrite reductase (NADH) small subunit|uniref:Rieske (2Fe-2S) protein n=1 Tax=Paenibacillus sp. MY03 TaxID=302980 RepID=UPI000B3C6023|nr:Rieske (2Fe-2S) protein [Paenibacillus sp. MY03]OUS78132.1 2Fe-2S ferredoxin [Paenibacillus sp. MY03]
MKLHFIGLKSDFQENERKLVDVNGKSVGVFRLDGELYAVLNYCPHQGAPLCQGHVRPWVNAPAPGEFGYDRDGEILRCPWHQWEFDIKTGCMVVDGKVRTRTYEVTVETFDVTEEDGKVYVKA